MKESDRGKHSSLLRYSKKYCLQRFYGMGPNSVFLNLIGRLSFGVLLFGQKSWQPWISGFYEDDILRSKAVDPFKLRYWLEFLNDINGLGRIFMIKTLKLFMIILRTSYDHLMIILQSSYDHLTIILWSSYDHLMIILWSCYNHLMIILWSFYDHFIIILW